MAINLYNIDRGIFVVNAPVRTQCSGDYFYGKDPNLEKAIQCTEAAYAAVLRSIMTPSYELSDEHRMTLKYFCLLQSLRTEAASRRLVEMQNDITHVAGAPEVFRMEIKEAVRLAMRTFADSMNSVSDLKVCLVRNKTTTPFVTSDNPAVLTNRWYHYAGKNNGLGFGFGSGGVIFLLPLSPEVLCVVYDGDVYSMPHENGWVDMRKDSDAIAFNEHQFLNCRANIFVDGGTQTQMASDQYVRVALKRPASGHRTFYAILDRDYGHSKFYRVVDRTEAEQHEEAIIHPQVVHAAPTSWPTQIAWRPKGCVLTNDTARGYVRRGTAPSDSRHPFRKLFLHA